MARKIRIACLLLAATLCFAGCDRTTIVVLPIQTGKTSAETTLSEPAYTESTDTEPTLPSETEMDCTEPSKETAGSTDDPGQKTVSTEPSVAPPTISSTEPSEPTDPPVTTTPAVTDPPPETTAATEMTEPGSGCLPAYSPGGLEYELLAQINALRRENGLAELTMAYDLCGLAYERSRECAQTGSRYRPDGSAGITILDAYGIGYGAAGELVTAFSTDCSAAEVAELWIYSTEASSILLFPTYRLLALGVYTDGGLTFLCGLFIG